MPVPYPHNRPLRRAANRLFERWCVLRSHLVICATDSFTEMLRSRYPELAPQIHTIRNGYDPADEIQTAAPTGKLEILFAGTIYLLRNPMPLLEGLQLFLQDPSVDAERVHLTMVGDCHQFGGRDLLEWTYQHGIASCVTFRPAVSHSEVRSLTARSNVLVNFAQACKPMITAKLFEQIAARRPILLFSELDSETARCAASTDSVIRLDDDPAQVRNALMHLYGRFVLGQVGGNATAPDISQFSRRRSNDMFLAAFATIGQKQALARTMGS